MLGLNKNKKYVITSKKLEFTDIFGGGKTVRAQTIISLGRFLNDTYFIIINDKKAKLLRTSIANSIIGETKIILGQNEKVENYPLPDYSKFENYEDLLNNIEDEGDWEAMKAVYKHIDRTFNPTGSHFPGYSGIAMRGGWIADTVSDDLSKREIISELIINQSSKNPDLKDLIMCEGENLPRRKNGPVPDYLKHKIPLICLHRCWVLTFAEPEEILDKFEKYYKLWDECLALADTDFSKHGIESEMIEDVKNVLFKFGLEIYVLLPAPINKLHTKLENLLKNSKFVLENEKFTDELNKVKAEYQQKWLQGTE